MKTDVKKEKIPWLLSTKHNRQMFLRRKTATMMVYGFLILLLVAAAFSSEVFMKPRNLHNLFSANTGLLLVTFAQLFVISLGGVDLSVGSVISVVNVVLITLMNDSPVSWFTAIAASLAIGAAVGLFNGLLVVKGNMQPIIATLATQTIFAGAALFVMDIPGGTMPSALSKFIAKGWGYKFPMLYVAAITAAVWLVINRTGFGRSLMAVGGSEQAAESSGIPVARTKILAFVASGLLTAVAAVCITAYTTSGNPLVGEAYTQRSITTAVVGGAALAGGRCSVVGCLAAVLIMGIINNLLNLLGMVAYYQYVMQGVILVAALAVSAIRIKR